MNYNKEVPHSSPNHYTDLAGNVRSFTHIDHDPKTRVQSSNLTEKSVEELNEEIERHRKELVQKVLELPPSICPTIFHQCTIRGDIKAILWNEELLNNLSVDKLRDIHTLITNKMNLI